MFHFQILIQLFIAIMEVRTSFFRKENWHLTNQNNKVINCFDSHLSHMANRCHMLNPIVDESDSIQTYFENSVSRSDKFLSKPATCIITKKVIYPCLCVHCQDEPVVSSLLTKERLFVPHLK